LWQYKERGGEREFSTALARACFDGEVKSMKFSRYASLLDFRDVLLLLITVLLCASVSVFAQGGSRSAQAGAQSFDRNCAACHGSDGKGSDRGADIATAQKVISLSDADLVKIVHNGTAAGMPPFAQLGDPGITAVVAYLRTLQGGILDGTGPATPLPAAINGNPANGRDLFFGKAQCSSCHMVAGEGGVLGPDMTGYATTHEPAAIRQSIVSPGTAPAAAQGRRGGGRGGFGFGGGGVLAKDVEIVTKSGEKLTGVVRNEDNLSIAMITRDGRYHFLDRSDVASETTMKTLMPVDYSTRLTNAEVDDIVVFLVTTGKSAPVEPAAVPAAPAAGGRRGGDRN
jgi:cytochrome c oxidase cbb3-type subunit 3